MHMKLDELWLDALTSRVDEQIVCYLKANHPEYQETLARQAKILKDYPVLKNVFEGNGCIKMDEQEHRAFKEYLANRDDMERLEREYYYYFGQSHMVTYGRILKNLQKEINPDGDMPRKEKLMELLIENRTSDAEMDFLKRDEEYQKRRKISLQQEEILRAMNPSKEIAEQVDKLTNSIGDYWSRYSDLIYQYAVQDILALLSER